MVRSAVKVLVRTRPSDNFADRNVTISPNEKSITVHLKRQDELGVGPSQQDDHTFRPDGILHNASQEAVYDAAAFETVERFVEGYNGSILAYGQTGSGKTYTMSSGDRSYSHRGIIPRAISHVFRAVRNKQQATATIRVSYLEIYNEQITDLLGNNPNSDLAVAENAKGSVFVKGLTSMVVATEEDALSLLFEGGTNRAIAEHQLNRSSSRSHAIFSISLELRSADESSHIISSKLNLVDLAGSERLSKTKSTGEVAKEATYINRSLSFLEQVTGALSEKGREHVPYRSSKLTHVLKDSLGGNCQTVMIATVWGEAVHLRETLSTLKFASRMARVSNEVSVNVRQDPESLLKRCEAEVRNLRQALLLRSGGGAGPENETLSPGQKAAVREEVRAFLVGAAAEPNLDITSVGLLREVLLQCRALYRDAVSRAPQSSLPPSRTSSYSSPSSFETLQPSVTPDRTSTAPKETATDTPGGSIPRPPFQPMPANIAPVGDEDCSGGALGVGVAPEDARPGGLGLNPGLGLNSTTEACGTDRSGAETAADRNAAFETYKKGAGAELQRVLAANKAALRERMGAAKELGAKVNECKRWIDELRGEVEALNERRGAGNAGENEPLVLEEDDFRKVVEMKELKKQYRALFEELKAARAEMAYTQKLVEQSTQQLLLGFDAWYAREVSGETATLLPTRKRDASSTLSDLSVGRFSSPPALVSPENSSSGNESHGSRRTSSASEASNPDAAAFLSVQSRTAGKSRRSSRVSPTKRISFGTKVSSPARSGTLQ